MQINPQDRMLIRKAIRKSFSDMINVKPELKDSLKTVIEMNIKYPEEFATSLDELAKNYGGRKLGNLKKREGYNIKFWSKFLRNITEAKAKNKDLLEKSNLNLNNIV